MSTARWCTVLGGAVLMAACHLVLDPDEFRGHEPDGALPPDGAPPDAMPLPDVNEAALELTNVNPASVPEGLGSSDVGPRAVVVVSGAQISDQAQITSDDPGVTIEDKAVSADGTRLALVLRVGVDPALADGASKMVTLTVTQGASGEFEDTVMLEVAGLDELEPGPGTLDTATLKPRYSRVVLDAGAVSLRGTAPARIVSTSDITIMAGSTLDADGATGPADGSAASVPGAGGCAGGAYGQNGACGMHGGIKGSDAGTLAPGFGGGGGGGVATGTKGDGGGGGGGGMAVGFPMLEALGPSGARGQGGGAGGAGQLVGGGLGGKGGSGGGGGGVIELTATGRLTVSAGVSANGGTGGAGAGGCTSGGGGGGGGSGGAVLLRAGGELSLGGALRAKGGAGGKQGGSGCLGGGAGADGWIRVDAPGATPGGLDADPVPARGAQWAATTPAISRSATVPLTLVGAPNTTYGWTVGESAVEMVTTVPAGTATIPSVPLAPGANTVCAYVTPGANPVEEARNCVSIVYLP
jgi:hypothetical protein